MQPEDKNKPPSPWRAVGLLLEAARSYAHCLKTPAPACFLSQFGEHGLVFTLHFWIADVKDGRRAPQSEVMLAILDKLRDAGLALARVPSA